MTKIVITGAGNVELTRKILSDLFSCTDLAGALHIALHDVDPGRLATAEALARRLDAESGAHARLDAALTRPALLDGADFVICQFDVGGYDALLRDLEIPRRYGLRQTLGDTIGVGGLFRALRTIPEMLALAADLAARCPDAWLLTYTDPMAALCWAVRKAGPPLKLAGLCHSVRDTHALLADLVGRELDEIVFRTAGVTHQSFVLRFESEGRSLYPDLDPLIAGDHDVRSEIYRRFGHYPTESSEHAAEYVPWFLPRESEVKRLGLPVDEALRRSARKLDSYERLRGSLAAGEPLLARWKHFEMASEVIHSMVTGVPREVYLTLPNRGLIDNLPAEACVEVPARVDGSGVHPVPIGALPVHLAALNRTYLNVVELTVTAALEERRSAVYQAAMLDPNTSATLPLAAIEELCDELADAHGALLPPGLRGGRR